MPLYDVYLYDIESVTQFSGYTGTETLLGTTPGQDLFPYAVFGDSDSDNPGATATFGNLTGTKVTITDDDALYENLDDGITVGTGRQTTTEFIDILNPTGASYLEYAYWLTDPGTGNTFKIYSVINYNYPGPNSSAAGFVSEQVIDPTIQYVISSPTRASAISGNDGNPVVGYSSLVACFAKGSMIRTIKGEIPVEKLKPGDHVLTMDNGYQVVRWVGAKRLDHNELARNPKLQPIRIRSGALGQGCPSSDLVLSPQHRIFVASKIAGRMFSETEVLVPAKSLLSLEGVAVAKDIRFVTYYHFLCEQHQIVYSNRAPTESLYVGKECMKSMSTEAQEEICALFPELCSGPIVPARALIPNRLARKLALRHAKNQKPLLTAV